MKQLNFKRLMVAAIVAILCLMAVSSGAQTTARDASPAKTIKVITDSWDKIGTNGKACSAEQQGDLPGTVQIIDETLYASFTQAGETSIVYQNCGSDEQQQVNVKVSDYQLVTAVVITGPPRVLKFTNPNPVKVLVQASASYPFYGDSSSPVQFTIPANNSVVIRSGYGSTFRSDFAWNVFLRSSPGNFTMNRQGQEGYDE